MPGGPVVPLVCGFPGLTRTFSLCTLIALTWAPKGKRKRGRPRETWRRTVERELEKEGLRTWAAAAASAAEDRTAWRQRAYGPILHLENG